MCEYEYSPYYDPYGADMIVLRRNAEEIISLVEKPPKKENKSVDLSLIVNGKLASKWTNIYTATCAIYRVVACYGGKVGLSYDECHNDALGMCGSARMLIDHIVSASSKDNVLMLCGDKGYYEYRIVDLIPNDTLITPVTTESWKDELAYRLLCIEIKEKKEGSWATVESDGVHPLPWYNLMQIREMLTTRAGVGLLKGLFLDCKLGVYSTHWERWDSGERPCDVTYEGFHKAISELKELDGNSVKPSSLPKRRYARQFSLDNF